MAVLQKFVRTHLNVDLIALIGKSGDLESHYSLFPGGREGHFLDLTLPFWPVCYKKCRGGVLAAMKSLTERPASLQQSSITALEVLTHPENNAIFLPPPSPLLNCSVHVFSVFLITSNIWRESIFSFFPLKIEWKGPNNKHSNDRATSTTTTFWKSENYGDCRGVGAWVREGETNWERAIVVDKNEFYSLSGLYTMGHRINGLRRWIVYGGVRWDSKSRKCNNLFITHSLTHHAKRMTQWEAMQAVWTEWLN